MTIYNWLTLLGIPGLLAGFGAFVRMQFRENRAVKGGNGVMENLRQKFLDLPMR